jgi:hypothetical protein
MPINIDHSKSGSVTLQASDAVGNSTFTFPSINGESTIFVSGSPVSYVSGLQNCLDSINQNVPFDIYYPYHKSLAQRTDVTSGNCAYGFYSIIFGKNGHTVQDYQIAQAIESSGNCCGWNQSVQTMSKAVTPSIYNSSNHVACLAENYFQGLDYGEAISYLNGKVVAKGASQFAVYDFCATIVQTGTAFVLASYTINTGIVQGGNYTFDIYTDSYSGEFEKLVFRVSGAEGSSLNWLMCLNELKTRTN